MFMKFYLRAIQQGLALALLAGCASDPKARQVPADTSVVQLATVVRAEARTLTGSPGDYDALLRMVGDARVVLLGEATHGTHEFYRERARITQRLIAEKGFTAVAVEGDWPRAYRVNRYVRGAGSDPNADAALGSFTDFPG
jgi:erythromycin esterase-like protein